MANIHKTAIIEGNVKLGKNVSIGAYSVLEGNIEIGDGTILSNNVVISSQNNSFVKIGKNNRIFPFAVIGKEPQDHKFKGEESDVIIGDNNTIREYVTINGGSELGNVLAGTKNSTIIGNNCYLYISSHIAHDVFLEDYVTITNCVGIAGHCKIGHHTIIGGLSGVHQFVNIGHNAMIGGTCAIAHDVPPFAIVLPKTNSLSGANIIGMKRNGFQKADILLISKFYDEIVEHRANREEIFSRYAGKTEQIDEIIQFLQNNSKRLA